MKDAAEKNKSEDEDNTEYDPHQETTRVEQSSDEEEDHAEVLFTDYSKDKSLS